MKPEWKEFLVNKGAELDTNRVVHFGNPVRERRAAMSGDVFCDMSHSGLVSVYGEDAETFLQGQLTNDIRQVTETSSQLSAYCSPKGRILANFRIFKVDSTYFLRMPRTMVDDTMNRLRMFVLTARVMLEDASNNFVRIGFSGPNAERHLKDFAGDIPDKVDTCRNSKGMHIVRVAGEYPRFEIYGELETMKELWTTLDVHCAPVGEPVWALQTINAGVPIIYQATKEAFVPQMINMQLINGVNFKKGCYTGQEIVARMQYLGKLKRRMYLAHINTDETPKPGTALFAESSTSGQGAGNIVNAQPDAENGYRVLAVVEINSMENDRVRLGSQDGPELEFLELPYPFPADE